MAKKRRRMNDMEFQTILDNGQQVTIHCEVEYGTREIVDMFAQDGTGEEVALSPAEQVRISTQAEKEFISFESGHTDTTYDRMRGASSKSWIIDASTKKD